MDDLELLHRGGAKVGQRMLLGALLLVSWGASASPTLIALDGWAGRFAHQYDYVLRETAHLDRVNEPVELTLTMAGNAPDTWRDHIRVVRLTEAGQGLLTPHQVVGEVTAGGVEQRDGKTPRPAASINVVFLADCAADSTATYRLFWGQPEGAPAGTDLPSATLEGGLQVSGEAPALTIANEFYGITLDPESGAIQRILPADQAESSALFYRNAPVHFGVDIWSPEQSWDHDYDWPAPPNQKVEGGPLALRYHRWGPMHNYTDVEVSITYTFYAHTPYVQVSSTMRLTQARSAHAIRMGEIVVSHSRRPPSNPDPNNEESPEVFTHYAWSMPGGDAVQREINTSRNELGQASVEDSVPGGLAVLDRDQWWIAGYNREKGYGLATLRKNQFSGNYLGGVTPQAAPCTYLGQYGWGFVYWSRPMVYPLGAAGSPLDLNTAVSAGTLFATEEALLVFKPTETLHNVDEASVRFTTPLRLEFKGTGPW
jgi:hypothetical protein